MYLTKMADNTDILVGADNTSHNVLTQNCRLEWPEAVCIFANVCGLTSTAIWFVVLFPQIVKNWRRKSVVGLSILWATANFTASLINLFFVLRIGQLPLYVKISAVYMPVLELSLLVQFWIYGTQYNSKLKWAYLMACLLLWAVIIIVQLLTDVYMEFQWCAIVLWSVETFPQVVLNMQRMSTSGQSTHSVALALFGKTTDFLSNYLLILPLQSVVMTYYSSTMAYINGVQVLWYWRNRNLVTSLPPEGAHIGEASHVRKDSRDKKYMYFTNDDEADPISDFASGDNEPPETESKHADGDSTSQRLKVAKPVCSTVLRFSLIAILILILTGYVVGLTWNTDSFLSLLAPGSVFVAMATSYLYRKKKMGY
ncbi:uncharacterized protein [Ptychodera flava]|uniref:uncharacterized protein isoform X2 n=1 Tax=Ptychodera flava TaxID=63121 RepID=UPI00396A8097